MRFRNMLLAAMAITALLVSAVFAQTVRPEHDHGPAKAKENKKPDTPVKQSMTAKELKARLDRGDKVIIIDTRLDLGGQILKGAVQVTTNKLGQWAKSADKNAVIVTYCTCPHDESADEAMESLLTMGFKKAYSLKGGLDAARAAGIEVVNPEDNKTSASRL